MGPDGLLEETLSADDGKGGATGKALDDVVAFDGGGLNEGAATSLVTELDWDDELDELGVTSAASKGV